MTHKYQQRSLYAHGDPHEPRYQKNLSINNVEYNVPFNQRQMNGTNSTYKIGVISIPLMDIIEIVDLILVSHLSTIAFV